MTRRLRRVPSKYAETPYTRDCNNTKEKSKQNKNSSGTSRIDKKNRPAEEPVLTPLLPVSFPPTVTDSDLSESEGDFVEKENNEENSQESPKLAEVHNTPMRQGRQQLPSSGFSISKKLANSQTPDEAKKTLIESISRGDIKEVGRIIRQSKQEDTLTEVQLHEIAKSVHKPTIGMFNFIDSVVSSSDKDLRDILIGQQYMSMLRSPEHSSLIQLEASVNSFATAVENSKKMELVKKRSLEALHITPHTPPFPQVNLNSLYEPLQLIGDTPVIQVTNILVKILRNWLVPHHLIWTYSYRPNNVRAADKHFYPFPMPVFRTIFDFCSDILGVFLPEELLVGPIPEDHPFLLRLGQPDAVAEVMKRRDERLNAATIIHYSMTQSLRNLRNYHYDEAAKILKPCGLRIECTQHIRWESFRKERARLRQEGRQPDELFHFDALGEGNPEYTVDAYYNNNDDF